MFIFYFGTLSFLTPPVCLSVFVAASIANARPMLTAVHALRYAIVAYVIPFVFVFNPSFLLQGPFGGIAEALVAGVAGVFLVSIGLVGHFRGRIAAPLRPLLIAAGLATMFLVGTHRLFALAGLALLVGLVALRRRPPVPAGAGA